MPLGIDFTQIFLHLFNVAILFVGLYILLYAPVKKFMQEREDHYKAMDEEANKKVNDANAVHEKYTERMKNIDGEIAQKKQQATAEMNEFRAAKEKEAKESAERIVAGAKEKADAESRKIIETAKDEITAMVEEATRKVVQDETVSGAFDTFLDDAERSVQDGNA